MYCPFHGPPCLLSGATYLSGNTSGGIATTVAEKSPGNCLTCFCKGILANILEALQEEAKRHPSKRPDKSLKSLLYPFKLWQCQSHPITFPIVPQSIGLFQQSPQHPILFLFALNFLRHI